MTDWQAHAAALVVKWRREAAELDAAAIRSADRGGLPERAEALATHAQHLRGCAEELANAGTTEDARRTP